MPVAEAYRPGLLSSLLLGETTARTEQEEKNGQTPPQKPNKKRKGSPDGDKAEGGRAALKSKDSGDGLKEGKGKEELRSSDDGEGGAHNLASLFSNKNLKKFKRKERADKEADAAEVARITEEARERERRAEEEEASATKKKNKKAKKREAVQEEERRRLEDEKKAASADRRIAALKAAGFVEHTTSPDNESIEDDMMKDNQSSADMDDEDEGSELDNDLMEDGDERDSDSEPESVIAGQGGNSSDEEDQLQEGERDAVPGQDASSPDKNVARALKAAEALGKSAEAAQKKREEEKEKEEDEKEERTIFVGNLPTTFNAKKIKTVFKAYGAVESVRLRSVAVQGMAVDKAGDQTLVRKVCVNRGKVDEEVKNSINAYVVYKNVSSVEKALAANGMEIGGKHMRVDRAKTGEFDHTRSVFLGNLPLDAGEEEVRMLFSAKLEGGDAAVEGVRLVRDKATLVGKGFGYVLLSDRAVAAAALALQGAKLRGRTLRVMPCGKRTKGRGGNAKPGAQANAKFLSFEGRRATAKPDGVLRRLHRREELQLASGSSAGGIGKRNESRNGSNSAAHGEDSATRPAKKPRWTGADGQRAGKAAGGRGPVKEFSGRGQGRGVRGGEVEGRGRGRGGGRGRGLGGRGGRDGGRDRGRGGGRGGRGAGRGRGRGGLRGRGAGRGRGRGAGRG